MRRLHAAKHLENKDFNPLLDEDLRENVLSLCKNIADSRSVVAACFYGPRVWGYGDNKSDVNLLLMLNDFWPRLRLYVKPLKEISVLTLTVDQGVFEEDIKNGRLGEFVAEKVITPYEPLINEKYLRQQEVKFKKRIILELLEKVISEFPLSHELQIKADYFLYKMMRQRARLFPPITYSFLNMLRGNLREKNVESMMRGFSEALNELAEEDRITFSKGFIKISRRFVNEVRKRKIQVHKLRSIQKAVSLYVLSIFPKMMKPLMYDREIFLKTQPIVKTEELIFQLEDPRKHIQTSLGLVNLFDKITFDKYIKKVVQGKIFNLRIEELGGVLNSVHLLTFQSNHNEQKVVMKKFKDWSGFKWFPLALWSLGTKDFAVLGRSRMEKEYEINKFLNTQGFPAPKILYVNLQECLILKDYVEGENFVEVIKQILSTKEVSPDKAFLLRDIGRKIAEVHKLGVVLGDCKPENIIITKNGKPCFVDLEQATWNGNKAWDIAEFLYYSGHFVSPISSTNVVASTAKEFIKGYLEAGGQKETVKETKSVRYTRVFSIFTLPHVIYTISNVCKEMGE